MLTLNHRIPKERGSRSNRGRSPLFSGSLGKSLAMPDKLAAARIHAGMGSNGPILENGTAERRKVDLPKYITNGYNERLLDNQWQVRR
jgi:hypothetical protein